MDALPHIRVSYSIGNPQSIYGFTSYALRLLFELDETIGGGN
jgi:hypothetical protein